MNMHRLIEDMQVNAKIHHSPLRDRIIYRDVLSRYMKRHGGQVVSLPIAHDDSEEYLISIHTGEVMGKISPQNLFPEKFTEIVSSEEMPF